MILERAQVAAALPAYEVGGELGRGGYGVVVEGRHRGLGRAVAIKQLPRAFAAAGEVRERFVAGARLLASLDHPHVVPVYDFVEDGGLCLLVMEHLPGGTVWDRFAADGLHPEAAVAVALATCAALDHAHGHGVLHRDIKPENLVFSEAGLPKVTDFGIARMVGGDRTLVTRAGEVVGTPAYMAPEQATAGELGPPADVYGTGVMLYELLSGRLPHPDDGSPLDVLARHVHEDAPPLAGVAPAVPGRLAEAVMPALARDPSDRYPTAAALGVAIARAATAAWGRGWLARAGLPVVATGPLVDAVAPGLDGDRADQRARARTTVVTPVPGARPPVAAHARGTLDDRARAADVVPLAVPRAPSGAAPGAPPPAPEATRRHVLVAVVAALVAVTVAALGAGSPERGGTIPTRAVVLAPVGARGGAWVDVARDESLRLDLRRPVEVVAAAGVGLDGARVEVSAGGVTLATATGRARPGERGTSVATVDLGAAAPWAAGEATVTVTLPDGRRSEVAIEPAGRAPLAWFAAVLLAAASAGLTLVVAAPAARAAAGVLAGLAVVVAAWALGAPEPGALTVAAVVALSSAAALAWAWAPSGAGRR
jgi:serine/threonine-protein kinase